MIGKTHKWLDKEVDLIKEKGLYRQLRTISPSGSSNKANVDGVEYLMASSNNYLGLAKDRRLVDTAIKTLKSYGVGSTGSRLTTGNTNLHKKLEKRIAAFKNDEAAIVFSSGYLANIGTLSSLAGKEDVILSDQLNHASIIDGCRLSHAKSIIYRHVDMEDLREKLIYSQHYKRKFIITDGVFSMDGNIAPLGEIKELAEKYGAYIIVDDAHSTGVLGENGSGTADHLKVPVDVTVGTFSKAIGTQGGFVTGSRALINYLRNKARSFIFQTALPPSTIAATLKSIDIIESKLELQMELQQKVHLLRDELLEFGFDLRGGETPIFPIIIGNTNKTIDFSKRLEKEGIFAPAIRPPSVPKGESRIRLTIMATHTERDIQQISKAFYQVGKELEVI
ncbi:8-amino-7-oxononanoate synthase [Halobacillus karajensis]|uniref:8-amino-7-oxononanoate synthase n=1 Tax=Halobacillus karajensis TaxID=195088 RepID=UPI0008A749A0|nr:8-amino-7-oxononanoate synthase [Halobacillus karajensis]SEH57235.1 8-amino-7-oxononanoate synthase [Halobacillus karajensis]